MQDGGSPLDQPLSQRRVRQWAAAWAGRRRAGALSSGCVAALVDQPSTASRVCRACRKTSEVPDPVRGAMSRPEAGANASSWVVASRRGAALLRAPERSPEKEPSQGGRGGQKAGGGGGWRGHSGVQQPVGAGFQEPPLSFSLKNDWVGAVIGESGEPARAGRGGRGGAGPVASPPRPPRLQSAATGAARVPTGPF